MMNLPPDAVPDAVMWSVAWPAGMITSSLLKVAFPGTRPQLQLPAVFQLCGLPSTAANVQVAAEVPRAETRKTPNSATKNASIGKDARRHEGVKVLIR